MSTIHLTIDHHPVEVAPGQTVLDAARKIGLEIPTLCYLEKCGPLNSCLVCLVKINGKMVPSCGTVATPGMVVESETNEVYEARRTALELLFSDHVGDCLSPCHRLCPLRMNIPVMIRHIQEGKPGLAIATVKEALALPAVLGRLCHHPCEQGCRRGSWDEAAGIRSMERFVADADLASPEPYLPTCRAPSGKTVAIIGAGPVGLTAAYHLLRAGHSCIIADRHDRVGGSLREASEEQLPRKVLDAEVQQLIRLGAKLKLNCVLGRDITLEGLLRGFEAVLVATGEMSKAEGEALGLEMVPGGVQVKPDNFETSVRGVFAAGRVVKPLPHLVRAMSEGQAVAHCIRQHLAGQVPCRPDKPFSSMMGRLSKAELQAFAAPAASGPAVKPCDACSGLTRTQAGSEAARCLHCDCRSSGDCALQTYAQQYEADASRFRQERRPFEQQVQPGGVIFEPGKCIVCGICVKLAEMAREDLGLAFIGRGFTVRLAAPFGRPVSDGLRKAAEECVRHCPTGALVMADDLPPDAGRIDSPALEKPGG